jgi:hypothetical protein
MLHKGLILAGWGLEHQDSVNYRENTDQFISFVFVKIWEDLQMTDILEARINASIQVIAFSCARTSSRSTQQKQSFWPHLGLQTRLVASGLAFLPSKFKHSRK